MLHEIFEGSTWLGQLGDTKRLSQASAADRSETLEEKLAKQIGRFLDGIDDDISRISSRKIKAALEPTCSTSTWTRATALAAEFSDDWAASSQAFVRKDTAYYGFVDEAVNEVANSEDSNGSNVTIGTI